MLEDRTTPTPVITIVKGTDAYEGVSNGSFTLTRTDDPNFPISQPLSVNVSISGAGTATPGQDYQYITSNVTFAAGSATATVTVNVMGSPYDDSYVEPDETVILNIAGPGANYTIGNPSSATVIIVDNDTNAHDYYWIGEGADPNWYTAGNWTLDPVNKTWASDAPHGPRDNVYFDGALFSDPNDPRENSTGSGNYSGYNSFHMVDDYHGVVSLSSVTFGTYVQDSGTIDQPTDTTLLVVTSLFTWTGGTLNSTDHLATVEITGGSTTGTIAPYQAGAVNLGSNITLSDGAYVTMKEGTVNVTNDDWVFTVKANCSVEVDSNTGTTALAGALSKDLHLDPNGSWTVKAGDTFTQAGRMINEGTFTLKANAKAFFDGVVGNNVAYSQTGGATTLYGGSMLFMDVTGSKDMQMTGGMLTTVVVDNLQGYDNTATIAAHTLGITGGDIYINRFDGVPHSVFGRLYVDGEVVWTGGTYHPFVEGDVNGGGSNTYSDYWNAQKFTIGAATSLDPTSIRIIDPFTVLEVAPTSGYTWNILAGMNGVTGTPCYDTAVWDIDPVTTPPLVSLLLKAM